jgi:hypothetical protein
MKIVRPYSIVDSTLTACNVPETDYAAYNSGTTYALGALVIVIGTNVHTIYESLQAGNVGHDPITSSTWWLDRGKTNKWKMFDALVNSQTVYAGDITFTLAITGRVNSISFLNVYASAIRVVMTDAVDGVVYDETDDLRSDLGITDWWAWFFEPPEWNGESIVTGLPTYSNPTLSITISGIAGESRCGTCVVGLTRDMGLTQFGASVGIQDYSVKTRDTWGNFTIREQAFNKRVNFTLNVPSGMVDRLQNLLAEYRATPILYIGADEYGATAVLGFYKDFSISIAYFSYSVCTIEIEGLI